jgi:phospholipid/cholesterol/gamma-HCH transport system permease protein
MKSFVTSIGKQTTGKILGLKQGVSFLGEVLYESINALLNPRKIKWKNTLYYMDMCGREAVPIMALICFLMGLILGFQSAVQMKQFGTDIYVADLVGLSIVKELGPLMIAMIAAGRAGSAFAAELGTMKVNEEIDALTTMGFIPSRILIMPKLIAMVFVMPLLTVIGDLAGVVGGLVVGLTNLKLPFSAYLNQTMKAIHYTDVTEGLIKSFIFAILITLIGCFQGMNCSNDAQGVGRATTVTVVMGIFLIVVSDTIMTIAFSVLG